MAAFDKQKIMDELKAKGWREPEPPVADEPWLLVPPQSLIDKIANKTFDVYAARALEEMAAEDLG